MRAISIDRTFATRQVLWQVATARWAAWALDAAIECRRGLATRHACVFEQSSERPQREAHHAAVAPIEFSDGGHVLVLDGVSTGLIQRTVGSDVGEDFVVRE